MVFLHKILIRFMQKASLHHLLTFLFFKYFFPKIEKYVCALVSNLKCYIITQTKQSLINLPASSFCVETLIFFYNLTKSHLLCEIFC